MAMGSFCLTAACHSCTSSFSLKKQILYIYLSIFIPPERLFAGGVITGFIHSWPQYAMLKCHIILK